MSWEASTVPTAHDNATQNLIDNTRSIAGSVKTMVSDVRRASEHQKATSRSNYSITHDDAVDALCDMKADEDVANDTSDGHIPIRKGAIMMKRVELKDNDHHPPTKKQKIYIPAGTGKKKNSICNSCKKQGIRRVITSARITTCTIKGWRKRWMIKVTSELTSAATPSIFIKGFSHAPN